MDILVTEEMELQPQMGHLGQVVVAVAAHQILEAILVVGAVVALVFLGKAVMALVDVITFQINMGEVEVAEQMELQ